MKKIRSKRMLNKSLAFDDKRRLHSCESLTNNGWIGDSIEFSENSC